MILGEPTCGLQLFCFVSRRCLPDYTKWSNGDTLFNDYAVGGLASSFRSLFFWSLTKGVMCSPCCTCSDMSYNNVHLPSVRCYPQELTIAGLFS